MSGGRASWHADAIAAPEDADLQATVYSVEPTGEATLVVVRHQENRLVVKVAKLLRPEIDSAVGLKFAEAGLR